VEAVEQYLRHEGVSLGRATTRIGDDVARRITLLRADLAKLLGRSDPADIAFAYSGTDALNTVLHGFLKSGDHVVTTDAEHNSVLRPLHWLAGRGVEVSHVPVDSMGRVSVDAIRSALRPTTRLIAVTHASNVTGAIQPIEAISQLAAEMGVRILLDGCQTAGHLPIDLDRLGIDFFACSAHKGLLGPLGVGVLAFRAGTAELVESFRQGGTGTRSESPEQPGYGPDRFEAGNHNTPGLLGLAASIRWLAERGVAQVRAHEVELTGRLMEAIRRIPGVVVPGPEANERVGVVSVVVPGFDSRDVAAILDSEFAIECRAGLHCAPRIHAALGSVESGGTVRSSLGPWNTEEDVNRAAAAIEEIAGSIQ
jgi:cysteine desulfurase/selenocysteine lyase